MFSVTGVITDIMLYNLTVRPYIDSTIPLEKYNIGKMPVSIEINMSLWYMPFGYGLSSEWSVIDPLVRFTHNPFLFYSRFIHYVRKKLLKKNVCVRHLKSYRLFYDKLLKV